MWRMLGSASELVMIKDGRLGRNLENSPCYSIRGDSKESERQGRMVIGQWGQAKRKKWIVVSNRKSRKD